MRRGQKKAFSAKRPRYFLDIHYKKGGKHLSSAKADPNKKCRNEREIQSLYGNEMLN